MQGHIQLKFLLDDRHQHVGADGDPDLRPHGVLRDAIEALDAQMLLDPLEEQLDLPSAPVQGANDQRRQRKLVAQEHQVLAAFGVAIADAAQVAGVVLDGIEAIEGDGLIADESRVGIDRRRSSSVCSFTAALAERNGAHGNIDRHRSMVVASSEYTVLASSTPKSSPT